MRQVTIPLPAGRGTALRAAVARPDSCGSALDTEVFPPEARFDVWREAVAGQFAAVNVRTGQPQRFRGRIRARDLGGVTVASVLSSQCTGVRTERMIRRDDPGLLQLALSLNSRTVVRQNREDAVAAPTDFALFSTSRPYVVDSTVAGPPGPGRGGVRGIMVLLPRDRLPVPARALDTLTPAVLPGRSGIGALLAGFLTGLVHDPACYPAAESLRLGTALVDLTAALLAQRVADPSVAGHGSRQRALLLRIHAFVEAHLEDSDLTPATVAAAHHISERVLHRLFERQELGVAAWIRHRRLERCRRDLIDPHRPDRSIQAIASRYGFPSAPHFSRLFRATYGLSPREYRVRAAAGNRARAG